MIVFYRLTTRMIVHDRNHWPDSDQKTCCRPLSSRKIHTFTSLSYWTPYSVHIFTRKELGTCCSRNFACATAGELSSTITNFFCRLTIWMRVGDSWLIVRGESTIIDYHALLGQSLRDTKTTFYPLMIRLTPLFFWYWAPPPLGLS